uniref:Uncharacterized protein n=1 Tax=Lygus hesperus TaxID=30085 RepID=A0A0K8S509_LYGHE
MTKIPKFALIVLHFSYALFQRSAGEKDGGRYSNFGASMGPCISAQCSSVGYPGSSIVRPAMSMGYPGGSVGYPRGRVGYPGVSQGYPRSPIVPYGRPQFSSAIMMCYECGKSTMGFIGKVEHMILSLPMAVIRGVIRIPSRIIATALDIGSTVLGACEQANGVLESFIGTLFELPARIIGGSVRMFLQFLQRMMSWGQGCRGVEYCQRPLPVIDGIGPCAGLWPCKQTVACSANVCRQASRALQQEEQQLDLKDDE